jgi:hypothetical protein
MGYERVSQVEDRGQFALRGGLLDLFAATAERAVRVELFDVEIESLRTFSTFTQRSLEALERIEVAPAAELALEHRGDVALDAALGGAGGRGRPTSPSCCRSSASAAARADRRGHRPTAGRRSEELAPTLRDHWADVCAAFHDADAHHLYVAPEEIEAALARARADPPALARRRRAGVEFHAQAAGGVARSLGEAEPELERDLRSGYRTVVTWTRRGDGERAAHNLTRLKAAGSRTRRRGPPDVRPGVAARGLRRAGAAARRDPRPPAVPPPPHPGAAGGRAPRRAALVHRACARATSSSTRTTASRASRASRRAPSPASRATTSTSNTRATTASSCPPTSSRRSPATSAPAASIRRCRDSAAPAGTR